ncbi:DUF2169 family type VI secretion system accessory protein [Gallaecimonas pentaromativorans]|uniref:Pentapeptide repeat protein n=1 Tax=Gallaecimonas pentaromativorans TaxID=584787 RepID=A0A3N1PRC6_9GAMM|nr:DUF2169 domain-containing protein [Gallaecimonas pentaromativorans]ROQ30558.1 pentapeptide repeat protein [Gallaecimonas pentaromativorans]
MKIVKPLTLGLLTRPYRQGGQHRLCLAALGFFKLGEQQPRFLDEAQSWPKVLSQLPAGTALDEVYGKPHGEFLLAGSAFAPGAAPVTALTVTAALGPVTKTLEVLGERRWYYGPWYRIEEPAPFTEMPLTLRRAYGGPKLADNPQGTGYTGNPVAGWVGQNQGDMPNLQYPHAPIHGHVLAQPIASFAALDPSWPQRRRHAGSYDDQWLLNDAPGLAADLNPLFFQRAAADQWQQGPWQGGEDYRLENLHPQQPLIEGQLPALVARGFARNKDSQQLQEVAMALDTVWFFPSVGLGVAIYHGNVPCQDSLAQDLDLAMVAYESPAAPKDADHYRQVAQLRSDVKTAAQHVLNEAQLAPALAADQLAARRQQRAQQQQAALAHQQAVLDELDQELWAQSAQPKPANYQGPKAQPPLLDIDIEALKEGEQQLSDILAQVDAIKADADAKAKALKQQQAQQQKSQPKAAPVSAEQRYQQRLAQAATPAWDLVGAEDPNQAKLKAALRQAVASGQPQAPSEAQLAELEQQLAKQAAMARQAQRLAMSPQQPPLAPEQAQRLGTQIRQWLAGGVPLKGRNLSGADLRGCRFDGLDLQEVNFEQANLAGCSFVGAKLQGAVFVGSQLAGANLSQAQLQGANFCQAKASGSTLSGAKLNKAMAIAADFSGATLQGADLSQAICNLACFERADLGAVIASKTLFNAIKAAASHWQGAQLESATFYQAGLQGSGFEAARLHQCVLLSAQLDGSRWQGARLSRTLLTGASAVGIDARQLHCQQCGLGQVDWRQANLSGAFLAQCDLAGGNFQAAVLDGAILAGALLNQAQFQGASAIKTNFLKALAQGACFDGANLTDACLLKAFLQDARFQHCHLQGAQFDAPTHRQLSHQRRLS